MIRKSQKFRLCNDRGFKQDISKKLNSSRQIKKSKSEVAQIWKFSVLDFYRFYNFAMKSSFHPNEPNIVRISALYIVCHT